jgi:hypothetical protein
LVLGRLEADRFVPAGDGVVDSSSVTAVVSMSEASASQTWMAAQHASSTARDYEVAPWAVNTLSTKAELLKTSMSREAK